MKSDYVEVKKLSKDKRGVFGLTSVQAFFAIILGIALLAYIIVVIMGTLSGTNIIADLTATVPSETGGSLTAAGYTLAQSGLQGFTNPVIIQVRNASTGGALVVPGNYTLLGNTLYNTTSYVYPTVNVTYSYSYNSPSENQVNGILSNTSSGVTGFFSAINPVYAILAILVIILVLVVLVRVVSGGGINGNGRVEANPQL